MKLKVTFSKVILILIMAISFSSSVFARDLPPELMFVMPHALTMPVDSIPTNNLFLFLGMPPFDKLDPNKTWYHSNGTKANIGDTWYHSNGTQANIGSTWYHSNNTQANIGSTWYHSNGTKANIGSTWYHSNGTKANN